MSVTIILPEQVKTAIKVLEACGHTAYVVGGCVRDSLRGVSPADWDMTTSARPDEIMNCFHAYKTIDTGIKHGTVSVLVDHMQLEITTFRTDGSYSDNRRPDHVFFTHSIEEDLSRRDFTIGAMAYHPQKGIIDPFGGGGDLSLGNIRCVGDPQKRFAEDALRIMRAFRFSAQLNFKIEQNTLKAAVNCRHLLKKIAAERITGELFRLISSSSPAKVLRLMHQSGIFTVIAPRLDTAISDSSYFSPIDHAPAEIVVRVALLLRCLPPKEATELLHSLKFDSKTTQLTRKILTEAITPPPRSPVEIRRLLSRCGIHAAHMLIDFFIATGQLDNRAKALLNEAIASGNCCEIKDLAINGADLIKIGIPQTKKMGELLNYLLNRVIENPHLNDKEMLLTLARCHFKTHLS